MKRTVVGIAGGSGCGKSTLCDLLVNELNNHKVKVIRTDQYFRKPLPKMTSPLSNIEYDDFNHPNALNYEKFMKDLNNLLNEEDNVDVIIVEGIFTLYFKEMRELLDLKIFIDMDADERMYRRIKRNIVQKEQSMEDIAEYYLQAAKHREMEFALPTKKYAEIIINGNNFMGNAKDVICCWITNRTNHSNNVD